MSTASINNRGIVETDIATGDMSFYSVLSEPFEPLALSRSMQLFPTALGLQPHTAALPSDEFLANLMSGRRTYKAIFREGFGTDFKNFLNFALRKVETTPATRQRLLKAVGGDEQLLAQLAEAARQHALGAQLAKVARALEGTLYQLFRALSTGSRKCHHCQAEMISVSTQWWSEQPCELGEAEGQFIDRILYDVLALSLLPLAFKSRWAHRRRAVDQLADLCDARAHIFRNWLDVVRSAYRAKDLTALAVRAGMEGPSPDSHLQRCARGKMLTVETIQAVTARLKSPAPLRVLGMHARALALAVDFLVAADRSTTPLDWTAAQAVLQARLVQLFQDFELNLSVGARLDHATM